METEFNKKPKAPFLGVVLLFGAAIVTGIVVGGLASVVGRFLYLIILFPVFMGLGTGMAVSSVVSSQKIRSPLVVIVAGLFATIITYGSMQYFDYLQFRSIVAKEIQSQAIAENGEPAPEENVSLVVDYLFIKATGMPGFLGYVLYEAKQGVSISHFGVGSGDSGLNLGIFTWVYWLVELGIIAYMSIEPAYKKTKDLFCENCGTWVSQGEHIGGIQGDAFNQAIEFIKRRDFVGFVGMLRDDTVLPSIEFYTRTCKTCSTFPFYLTGIAVSSGKKGQTQSRLIASEILNSSERFALTTELKAP
jgi:hypothetical protein